MVSATCFLFQNSELIAQEHTDRVESVLQYWKNNSKEIKENIHIVSETMIAVESYVGDANSSLGQYQEVSAPGAVVVILSFLLLLSSALRRWARSLVFATLKLEMQIKFVYDRLNAPFNG